MCQVNWYRPHYDSTCIFYKHAENEAYIWLMFVHGICYYISVAFLDHCKCQWCCMCIKGHSMVSAYLSKYIMHLLTEQCRLHKAFHPPTVFSVPFVLSWRRPSYTVITTCTLPKNCIRIPLLNSSQCREESILEAPWIHDDKLQYIYSDGYIQTPPVYHYYLIQVAACAGWQLMCNVMLLVDCLKDPLICIPHLNVCNIPMT